MEEGFGSLSSVTDLSWAYVTYGHVLTWGGGAWGIALHDWSLSNLFTGVCGGSAANEVLIWKAGNVPAISIRVSGDLICLDQESGYLLQLDTPQVLMFKIKHFTDKTNSLAINTVIRKIL